VIQTRDVKSQNSGGQCAPGFFDDVCDDESPLLPPPRGAAVVTVEDVEVRKEAARLELTEPLRESVGEAASGGGGL
jgi:hypothetical protein